MKETIFDFETEGLSLGLSRPWQVAFARFEGGKIIEKQDIYIDLPNFNISEDAARITKFNRNEYDRRKKPAKYVADLLREKMYNSEDNLVGHNILNFDLYIWRVLSLMVDQEFSFEPIINRCVDSLALARAFQNEKTLPPNLSKEDFVAWQYKSLTLRDKKTKNSLEALAKLFDIEYDQYKLHDALYDIELNIKIYNRLKYAFDI